VLLQSGPLVESTSAVSIVEVFFFSVVLLLLGGFISSLLLILTYSIVAIPLVELIKGHPAIAVGVDLLHELVHLVLVHKSTYSSSNVLDLSSI